MTLTLATVAALLASSPDAGVGYLDLARTWEAAQLFHPSVMHREVGLDEAFVSAVKALDAAQTPEARRAAVGLILAPLKDPASVVEPPAPPPDNSPLVTKQGDAVMLHLASSELDTGKYPPESWGALLGTAKWVVADLRGVRARHGGALSLPIAPSKEVILPPLQQMVHAGYDSNQPSMYGSHFEVTPSAPTPANPAGAKRKWAIVLTRSDAIPDWALALRQAQDAVFVSTEAVGDEGALTSIAVSLADGSTAWVRAFEYAGGERLVTDVQVPAGKDVLAAALAALRSGAKPKPAAPRAVEPPRAFALSPVSADFPDREHRMVGALRLWLAAKRFWAYPYLRTADADQVLLELFTKVADAATPVAYAAALREASGVLMPDAHTTVSSPDTRALAPPPFEARFVEDKVVLWDVTAEDAPLSKYDVLLEVDGVKMDALLADWLPQSSGTSKEAKRERALVYALLRPAASKLKVVVEQAGGKKVTAEVTWGKREPSKSAPPPEKHFKVLPNNLGYIDFVNLTPDEVDAALEAVKDTRGLVLDIRGYPKGTLFVAGPRLGTVKEPPGVAWFCTPLVSAYSADSCKAMVQRLPVWEGRRYTAPTVTLVNINAISHAEHSCLIIESYTKTTFVGTTTRGANGNIAVMQLPGGVRAVYTGLETKHADGRPLQSVGIVPDVVARPTIAGLRAGKDEVLEKGVAALEAKLKATR